MMSHLETYLTDEGKELFKSLFGHMSLGIEMDDPKPTAIKVQYDHGDGCYSDIPFGDWIGGYDE